MPVEQMPACDYSVIVSRAEDRPQVGIWPLSLSSPLPTVPIPVRAPDQDVELDLQRALHQTYDASGYHNHIYRSQMHPPLDEDRAMWAATLLRQHGVQL